MTIGQRVIDELEKRGLKQVELSRATGIGTSNINHWKTRKSSPSGDQIIPIANFLQVSPTYLLTGKEAETDVGIGKITLTNEENRLLYMYRSLSLANQQKVLTYMSGMYDATIHQAIVANKEKTASITMKINQLGDEQKLDKKQLRELLDALTQLKDEEQEAKKKLADKAE